ncbi:integrase core domain-containing protein [Halobacillus seohaensis]
MNGFYPKNANAHIESFHRLLEDECFKREEFESYAHAYEALVWYIQFYNERRMHASIQTLLYQTHHNGKITQEAETV